jgi:hypothetical protein
VLDPLSDYVSIIMDSEPTMLPDDGSFTPECQDFVASVRVGLQWLLGVLLGPLYLLLSRQHLLSGVAPTPDDALQCLIKNPNMRPSAMTLLDFPWLALHGCVDLDSSVAIVRDWLDAMGYE